LSCFDILAYYEIIVFSNKIFGAKNENKEETLLMGKLIRDLFWVWG